MRATSDQDKKTAGTFTPARARQPLGVETGVPARPSWLSAFAVSVWDSVVPRLVQSGVVSPVDEIALACYCELAAEFAENPRKMNGGRIKELRMLAAEFGCTINSRLKIKTPEGVKPPEKSPCPKPEGKLVDISSLLSNMRRLSPAEKLRPVDTSDSPAKDS